MHDEQNRWLGEESWEVGIRIFVDLVLVHSCLVVARIHVGTYLDA